MNNYRMEIYCIETTDGLEWNVEFPEVKGCGGAGLSVDEAILDAQQNLAVHLEFLKEEGMDIPIPCSELAKPEYSGKISLRLGKTLHEKVAKLAEKDGSSINNYIRDAIAYYSGKETYEHKLVDRLNRIVLLNSSLDYSKWNSNMQTNMNKNWLEKDVITKFGHGRELNYGKN